MNECDSETYNEIKLLIEINHDNIVRYFDQFDLKKGKYNKTCLITEYCKVSR